jgi:16S rRNA (guanine966-N2)-methyltransferase
VRVVAGRFKGRRLQAPAGRGTRPTADRVREALFQVLGPLDGLRVLDLFAGSGALGIEALSRGAASAVFVERGAGALAALRRNLDALGVDAAEVRRADAFAFLARYGGEPFDLALIDPPYSSAPRLGSSLAERLPPVLAENARIVTESDKRAPLTLDLPLLDERTFGDTRVAIHRAR